MTEAESSAVDAFPPVVGLAGYSNSGKDGVGDILVREFGFERRSVGDVVLDVIKCVDPILYGPDVIYSPAWALRGWELSKWLASGMPYDDIKEQSLNLRPMMQRLGGALNATFGGEKLVETAVAGSQGPVVLTSTRHPSEAHTIKVMGGEVWRIERPGVGPANQHPAEVGMDSWDYDQIITNDGSLEDLARKVRAILARGLPVGKGEPVGVIEGDIS